MELGISEIDQSILLQLDWRSVRSFCQHRRDIPICNDRYFWEQLFRRDFPGIPLPINTKPRYFWLHQRLIDTNPQEAIDQGWLDLLMIFVNEGQLPDCISINKAVKGHHLEVIEFLLPYVALIVHLDHAYNVAIDSNDLEMVRLLFRMGGHQTNIHSIPSREMFNELLGLGFIPTYYDANDALEARQFEIFNELLEINVVPNVYGLNMAAKHGDLNPIKLIFERMGILPDFLGFDLAMMNGHLDVIKFLIRHDVSFTHMGIFEAIVFGQVEVLKYLKIPDQTGKLPASIYPSELRLRLNNAAKMGHLNMIEYWAQFGIYPYQLAAENAAAGGHLDLLKWLVKHKIYPYDDLSAIKGGHLKVFKYLNKHGFLNSSAINYATQWGHLEIIKYLNKLPDRYSFDLAISENYLNVVEYLLERRLIPSSETVSRATVNGQLEMVQLLGRFQYWPSDSAILMAVGNGYLSTIEYLADQNRWPSSADPAAVHNHVKLVRFLAKNEILPAQSAIDRAAIAGNGGTLEILASYKLYPSPKAIHAAYQGKKYGVIRLMRELDLF